jgi:hypothetical protein
MCVCAFVRSFPIKMASGPGRSFRRGGRRQRQAATELVDAAVHGERVTSTLAKHLLQQWAWGHYSAAELQRLAFAAREDEKAAVVRAGGNHGHCDESLAKLAALGRNGQYSGNIQRDLIRWLGETNIPSPLSVNIEAKIIKPKAGQPAIAPVPMMFMLPHVMFHHLFVHHKAHFNELFLGQVAGGASRVLEFWQGVAQRRDPRVQNHPMMTRPGWHNLAIPISLHGDAVPCLRTGRAGSKSLDAYSWQGLLGTGPTLFVKHYIFGVFTTSVTENTMGDAWRVISWSLWWLFQGMWPTCDHLGVPYSPGSAEAVLGDTPLAEGFFAVPWLFKGDIKHFSDNMGLRHCQSLRPCDFCPCHRVDGEDTNFGVYNFSINAAWKSALFSADEWRALNPERHIMFNHPWTFLSQLNVEPDELHVLHLGVNQVLLGTVLWLLVYLCLEGPPAQNIATVWRHVRQFYSEHAVSTQFNSLTLNSFTEAKRPRAAFPRLKGKGMEVQQLLDPLLSVFTKFKRVGNEDDRKTERVLAAMSEIQQIFSIHIDFYFLPPTDARRVLELADRMLEDYAVLHLRAAGRGELLFAVLPKCHWLWHLFHRSQFHHPRLGNTCLDEDFVGRVKKIVANSAAGMALHLIPVTVMTKFRWGKEFMYKYRHRV